MRVATISLQLYTKYTHEENNKRLIKAGYADDAKPWTAKVDSELFANAEVYTLRNPATLAQLKHDYYQPMLQDLGDSAWITEENNYMFNNATKEPIACVSKTCDNPDAVNIPVIIAINPNIDIYLISTCFDIADLKVVDTNGYVYFQEKHLSKNNYGRYINSFGIDTIKQIVF